MSFVDIGPVSAEHRAAVIASHEAVYGTPARRNALPAEAERLQKGVLLQRAMRVFRDAAIALELRKNDPHAVRQLSRRLGLTTQAIDQASRALRSTWPPRWLMGAKLLIPAGGASLAA
jgi:hypothetical protein